MKKYYVLLIIGLLSVGLFAQSNAIAVWNYNTISGTPAAPIADIGSGNSLVVGAMTVATAATGMDPIINNGCGSQNGTNPGAWSFTATPGLSNESSGVQYQVSTVGYQNVLLTWDMRFSNTAANTVRLQYTIDGLTWQNFTMTSSNTTFCNGVIDNGRFQNNGVGDQYRRISVSFTGVTGIANNANFGVRILAAHYQTSGEFRQTSTPTLVATAGTWRFDNVTFEGRTDVSIPAASNFFAVNENAGVVNIPVLIANANAGAVNLTLGFSVYSNATVNSDFTWSNTLSIPANTNGTFNVPVTIIDDNIAEKAERIIVKIVSSSNANISTSNNYSIIFIKDNDYIAPIPTNELNLQLLTSFSNGAAGTNSAEIVAFDPTTDRLYIANSIGQKLDIVNFANPSAPVLLSSISMLPYGGINSVVAKNGIVAVAIENSNPQLNGSVVFFNQDGVFQKQVTVGAMPDMICFNNDMTRVLTANEGEPNSTYSVDPEGSVSIIDISSGIGTLNQGNVTTISLTAFNGQETALRAQGIRIFSSSASVAQDLEPEYIAISADNTKAYVSLQENNALLTINLSNNTIISMTPFGYANYGAGSNNALDASDQSGMVLITGDLPIKGAYMPDAIAFQQINNQGYLFTANEGDSREFGIVIDANRISSSTFNSLDATAFADQAILRNNKFLGRLSALKYSGDTDGDGDYDELHVMSGRSFSIWNASTGALVFDSKDLIEQITANHPVYGAMFNASNTSGAPSLKNRSDDKGPEVEGIAVRQWNGHQYVFASLERIGGVMVFNIDNPAQPVFVGYANNRSVSNPNGPDLGAEGIIVIEAQDSPNGKALLLLANEVSSTLSIYQLNNCAVASGATIVASATTICSGQTASLTLSSQPGVNYQWLLNGQALSGATSTSFSATTAGTYKVAVQNNALGCADTSIQVAIVVNPLPNVTIGLSGPTTFCQGQSVTLTAPTANSYLWSNGSTAQTISIGASGTYTLTATSTGCSATSTPISITVNPLPNVVVSNGGPLTFCQGGSVLLTAPVASSYLWSTGQTTQQISVTNAGNYSLTSQLNGCTATSPIVSVQVNPSPVVNAGIDQTVCSGPVVSLLVTGTANQYSWNNGYQGTSLSVPTAGFSGSTTYTITGINTSTGCTAVDQVVLNILATPTVNAGSSQTICLGQGILLNAQSANANLMWSNGMANGQTFYPVLGQTSLSVQATANNSCVSNATLNFTVNPLPNVNAGLDQVLCANEFPVTLNATSNLGQVSFLNQNNAQISVSNGGSYIAAATAPLTGCIGYDTVHLTMLALPVVNLNTQYAFCENELPYTIQTTTTSSYPVYEWSTGSTTPYLVDDQTGSLSLVVTDSNGCSAVFETSVSLLPAPSVSLGEDLTICEQDLPYTLFASGSAVSLVWSTGATSPSIQVLEGGTYSIEAFAANGCSEQDLIQISVENCAGIQTADLEFSVYPNPTTSLISVNSNLTPELLQICGNDGKLLQTTVPVNEQTMLSLDEFSNGIYFLKIYFHKEMKVIKIVKQ